MHPPIHIRSAAPIRRDHLRKHNSPALPDWLKKASNVVIHSVVHLSMNPPPLPYNFSTPIGAMTHSWTECTNSFLCICDTHLWNLSELLSRSTLILSSELISLGDRQNLSHLNNTEIWASVSGVSIRFKTNLSMLTVESKMKFCSLAKEFQQKTTLTGLWTLFVDRSGVGTVHWTQCVNGLVYSESFSSVIRWAKFKHTKK